ncbi:RNA polymerase sigma factor SigJ [Paraflavitalea sp. CAU 1676]|uniref:RNA polymerase sigma factor SigJ n=1 Tax=Paraflavitalea sp. CAU 1676 TaxID=3032598 RepID=UPI0023DBAAEF|nr:RNA polymerase sigma factor SigJ [Paraflavitalea sp. CAU 1676]MDF2193530.1 RNA polymerase sigma factor SigJ [Paraflavitalea sp. CAU 1676]
MVNKDEIFREYKSLLFSIAYNMLGQVAAAEDIVQDTFVKWLEADTSQVRQTKAYLVKSVTNASINYLQSARIRRESYVGIWLPEPLHQYDGRDAQTKFETWHTLSIGILVLLEKLSPVERAVFLLREIFSYDYAELAEVVEKSADNCRQICKRAKDSLGKDARRFAVDIKVHERILQHFMRAIEEGHVDDLVQVLKEDIVLLGDGGGTTFAVNGQRITATANPIYGVDKVSRLLLKIVPKFDEHLPGFHRTIVIANNLPGIISYAGTQPVALVSIEPEGDKIKAIYVQTNPEKLKRFVKLAV